MKKRDILLAGGIVLVALVMLLVMHVTGETKGDQVQITVNGEIYGTYPLEKDQTTENSCVTQVTATCMSMHCLPMLKRNITIYPHLQWILRKLPGFFPVPAFSTVNIIQKSVNICRRSSLSSGVTIRNAKTDFPFCSLFFCVNFLGWKHKKAA